MTKDQEIKLLKQLVSAQNEMIAYYRIGSKQVPEKVFKVFDKAKKAYGVDHIMHIK